jgi:hypothetical protein
MKMTAEQRWRGVGPYYAMFPKDFARRTILRYTVEKDWVLDPFCGRGTSTFEAAIAGRNFTGIEISPVGWVFARVKDDPAPEHSVRKRLHELGLHKALDVPRTRFFRKAYCLDVRRFLAIARQHLNWRGSRTDRTLMAIILIHLHDHWGVGLSNQMQQAKAVDPAYAIRWWDSNGFPSPPNINPYELLARKIGWRYKKGLPKALGYGKVYLGDAREVTPRLNGHRHRLLLTSPPYCGVTDYSLDQWLRLWMLGEHHQPKRRGDTGECRGRFRDRMKYRQLLLKVLEGSKKTLTPDATIYLRTDARKFTRNCTREVLVAVFPKKMLREHRRPVAGAQLQTKLYGTKGKRPGEVDFILTHRSCG